MKKLTLSLLTVAVSVTGAFAGTSAKTFKQTVAPAPECKFRDQELQVDAFAAGAFYNQGRPGWGGGLGVNYFFTKFIGLGVEQDVLGREKVGGGSNTEWATSGNLFLRYPIFQATNIFSHSLRLLQVMGLTCAHVEVNMIIDGIKAMLNDWVPRLSNRCIPTTSVLSVV